MASNLTGLERYHWFRILGGYGIAFIALFLLEFVLNWKSMPFGDNFGRSILIATGWSLVFACWDAFFGKIAKLLGIRESDDDR